MGDSQGLEKVWGNFTQNSTALAETDMKGPGRGGANWGERKEK